MHASQPTELYNNGWDKEFTTVEALYERIKVLAENGAYEMCVYVDSKSKYNEIYHMLAEAGYGLEHYNGGNNGIIRINWG